MGENIQKQGKLTQEEIDSIFSAITDPKERAEKIQLFEVFIQLNEGLDRAHDAVELGKTILTGK